MSKWFLNQEMFGGVFFFVFLNTKINSQSTNTLTLSSTISMENSLPSPRELLHVRMELLLVTRARIVHLLQKKKKKSELIISAFFIFRAPYEPRCQLHTHVGIHALGIVTF